MKILMVFVDMLRINKLHMADKKNEVSEIDEILKKWGGVLYTNCYTPGPDTPRSQATVWSSRIPKKNGCDTRIKYPLFYMNNPQANFLRILAQKKYKLNFFIDPHTVQVGELPEDFLDCATYSSNYDLNTFLDSLSISDDSFTYICLEDFHFAVDDYCASEKAWSEGCSLISEALENIDTKIGRDRFDYILVYSDHGYKENSECKKTLLSLLGEDRSKVFLYIRKKGDKELSICDDLTSLMDIGPTVAEMANCELPYNNDGESLWKTNRQCKRIVINDHRTFDVSINQTIERWAIVSSKGLVAIDCNLHWESDYELLEEEKEKFLKILLEEGCFFAENIKATRIRKYYDSQLEECKVYSNGMSREKHVPASMALKKCIKNGITKLISFVAN